MCVCVRILTIMQVTFTQLVMLGAFNSNEIYWKYIVNIK